MSNGWSARGNRGNDRDYRGASDREAPAQQSYPNSGALFPVKQKRSDNSPDQTGNIVISDDVLDYVLRLAESGEEVKLDLSAWIRISRNNTSFTSVKINIPYSVRMEEQGNPTYQARPRYNQQRNEPRPEPRPRRDNYDDEMDVRQQASQPARRGGYAEQSGRDRPQRMSDEDFKRGDSMPDWLRDKDDVPF
jgi:hypothetical protein